TVVVQVLLVDAPVPAHAEQLRCQEPPFLQHFKRRSAHSRPARRGRLGPGGPNVPGLGSHQLAAPCQQHRASPHSRKWTPKSELPPAVQSGRPEVDGKTPGEFAGKTSETKVFARAAVRSSLRACNLHRPGT